MKTLLFSLLLVSTSVLAQGYGYYPQQQYQQIDRYQQMEQQRQLQQEFLNQQFINQQHLLNLQQWQREAEQRKRDKKW